MHRQLTRLDTPIAGLRASPPHPLPFDASLHIRAFLLERDAGNLLVYAAPTVDDDALHDAGGATRQYLNHRHEAGFAADLPDLPVFCHSAEREDVAQKLPVRAAFSMRHMLGGDFEVIPTPGHTRGATAYLWDSGEHRFLFTGDTIYLRDGEWVAAVLPGSSDREAYVHSLELIRGLDFDVLVPWAATGGLAYHAVTEGADARRRIDAILARVQAP